LLLLLLLSRAVRVTVVCVRVRLLLLVVGIRHKTGCVRWLALRTHATMASHRRSVQHTSLPLILPSV
jgi:hypothetical protein